MNIKVREIREKDAEKIVSYFLNAKPKFLKKLGADQSKLPEKQIWVNNIEKDIQREYQHKNAFYIIWLLNDHPVGHSNINNIKFGKSAEMHMHIWSNDVRKSGLGPKFLKQTIPLYFELYKLQTLICEPNSENDAPNKTLKKLGFKLTRSYETFPSPITFKQVVNRYELDRIEVNPT